MKSRLSVAGLALVCVELSFTNSATLICVLSPEMLNEARKKNVYQKFICAPLNSDQNPEVNTGEYDAMICIGTLAAAHVKCMASKHHSSEITPPT